MRGSRRQNDKRRIGTLHPECKRERVPAHLSHRGVFRPLLSRHLSELRRSELAAVVVVVVRVVVVVLFRFSAAENRRKHSTEIDQREAQGKEAYYCAAPPEHPNVIEDEQYCATEQDPTKAQEG
jgi:hypothetical protein